MDTPHELMMEQAEGFLHPSMADFVSWLEWTLNQDLTVTTDLDPEQLSSLKEVYWNDYLNDLMFSYQVKREKVVY